MFIPTNSDGQVSVNLRKTKEKKIIKRKTISLSHPFSLSPVSVMFVCFVFIFFSFSLDVGPICPFIPFLGPFQPRNNLFCPGFNFIYHN